MWLLPLLLYAAINATLRFAPSNTIGWCIKLMINKRRPSHCKP